MNIETDRRNRVHNQPSGGSVWYRLTVFYLYYNAIFVVLSSTIPMLQKVGVLSNVVILLRVHFCVLSVFGPVRILFTALLFLLP